jgi:hypothetical protein
MPGSVGVVLAVCFALVAAHRVARRDPPGALMAAGMGAMSLGMAGVGPMLAHGPWWAAAFVLVAAWPLVDRRGAPVCGGPLAHLLGGVAMVYMCLLPMPAGPVTGTVQTVTASEPVDSYGLGLGHAGHADLTQLATPAPSSSTPLTLFSWALACYFLLGAVAALTRRAPDGTLASTRLTGLGEAVMGFGTVIMLVALT